MIGQLGRGVAWTYTSMGITGVLQVAVVAMTARLLSPEAFGLIAMANVILRFGSYFAQMGVGRALVQRAQIDDLDIRAAFTSSTILGLVTAATVIALAPLAALYYQADAVVSVVRWLALSFVFSGIGATGRALLQRRLHFRAAGAIEVASYAFGYALPTLALAINGFGVWSLVAGAIGQVIFSAVAVMVLTRHSIRPTLQLEAHRRLLGFGVKVSGISVLEFVGSSLDTVVIGRFGSATQLGIYNRAFMLAGLPTYQVHQGIAKVLFPVLSSGRSDRAAFARILEGASRTAIKLVLPLGIGMALTAPELVRVVLGEGWLESIPVFAVLAPALALNLLSTLPGQALDALGRLRWKAIVQAGYVVVLGSALIVTAVNVVDLHAITLVIAVAIGSRTVAMYALIYRTEVVSRSFLANSLRTSIVASVVTCAAFIPVMALLRRLDTPSLLTLTLAIVTGGLVLIALFRADIVRLWRVRSRNRQQ